MTSSALRAHLLALVVSSAAAGAEPALASPSPSRARAKQAAFAPFDAGAPRDVVRQGVKGQTRRAHPHVGAAAKVPGEGPPPPPLRADADVPELSAASVNVVGASLSSNPLYLAALAYQHGITRLDGPRCGHLPTCSRFASQAVARYGALGILLGLDRLIQPHDSSAIRALPQIEGFGVVRAYDPLDNYEFWRAERFTGLPQSAKEEPLVLAPLAGVSMTETP